MNNPTNRILAVIVFFLVLVAPSVGAQNSGNSDFELESGSNEYGIWVGRAPNNATLFGSATGRQLFLLGLRYGRVLGGTRHVAFEFTSDVILKATIYQPDSLVRANPQIAARVNGRGSSPFGLKIILNRRGRIKPFVNASGGFLFFERGTPVEVLGATRFNFTFEFGGGVHLFATKRNALSVGYKLHHISNARITSINPGLDSNVFYAGYSFFR
jgi:hypothetical protein